MLETRDVSVRVGTHLAVDRVSCVFRRGTLTVIGGEPGAGTTSYLDLLSGQRRPSSGTVRLGGRDITRLPPSDRARHGIGRGFQRARAFGPLSVVENVRLAVQARRREGLDAGSSWRAHRNTLERAHALVDRVHLAEQADAPACSLHLLDRRRLEFAMLMALEPFVYVFDRPTEGLAGAELLAVRELLGMVTAQRHKTVLLVERCIGLVRELADRVVLLREGRIVADGMPAEVLASRLAREAFDELPAPKGAA
jgi:branched-chain amino acid transport system ATP-binding protein